MFMVMVRVVELVRNGCGDLGGHWSRLSGSEIPKWWSVSWSVSKGRMGWITGRGVQSTYIQC